MKTFPAPSAVFRHALRPLAAAVLAWAAGTAAAQMSACTSDAALPPPALFERFISADCADCWRDPHTPAPGAAALLLDWIVPGAAGEEAPLSAAARRDALERLQALGRAVPATSDVHTAPVRAPRGPRPALRLALGPAVNDYVGASVRVRAPARGTTLWLVLAEALPAGSEGSPVARFVVRNTFSRLMGEREQLSKEKQPAVWQQIVPMYLPEGTQVQRLQLLAWMEADSGEVLAAARSVCAATP
ncbi:hypothetical protein [Comamonas granuli]|uniref:hypothetical protein n=1 Tax=Comamonas granuli TaxID=290309 RepID=UPI0005A95692|nr:hypothetical protein [Comamonas granuli]